MIHFFLTSGHAYTVRPFIDSWPDRLRTPIKLIPYCELIRKRELPRGACIFADIERLSTGQACALEPVWEQIAAQLPAEAVLNHPTRSMSRFNLLKYAYEQGINDFNVYWVSEGELPERYPVFIRQASEHNGNLTPLLHSEKELHKALESLPNKAKIYHDLMIVEFCDISDDQGIYRKYAAFRVGDAIIPRHLFFGREWMQKFDGNMEYNDSMLEEEYAYMEQNPHEPLLRKVADAAGLRYGRIDYGIKDGRVQIWEMNTNPMLIQAKKMPKYGNRLPQNKQFLENILKAFGEIGNAFSEPDPVVLRPSAITTACYDKLGPKYTTKKIGTRAKYYVKKALGLA